MIDIKILENSGFFEEKTLLKEELLFDEAEINNNFYIIKSGELNIEKYTTKQKKETKILANLKTWDFLWEASFTNSEPKQVLAKANKDSKLLVLKAENLEKFLVAFPVEWKNFLINIISTISNRVNIWNKYITSIYEINKSINNLEKINYLEIFKILEKIKLILDVEFIIYLEKNPVVENVYSYKYDSKNPLKMQNKIIDINDFDIKKEFEIEKNIDILKEKISIWKENLWILIIGKKDSKFNENEKRLFLGIITSIAWIIKQKEIFDEIRNKDFMSLD